MLSCFALILFCVLPWPRGRALLGAPEWPRQEFGPLSSSPALRPIILVCNTRTGSTALGTALAKSNRGVIFGGESFHPNGQAQDSHFLNWIARNDISAARFLRDKTELCRLYMEAQLSRPGRAFIFGVKYHDLMNLMPSPSLFDFPPSLFVALEQIGGGLLHLVRRSKFDSVISSAVAQQRRVFHVKSTEAIPDATATITVPPGQVGNQVRIRMLHETIVSKQVRNLKCAKATVYYEDLFGPDPAASLASMSDVFGFPVKMDKVEHKKLGRDYPSLVANYEKLLEASRKWESGEWGLSEM